MNLNVSITDRSVPSFFDDEDCDDFSFADEDDHPVPVQRGVTFASTLSIIQIPIVLGDNPACSAGPPVQMDPSPDAAIKVTTRNMDLFEHCRARAHRGKSSKAMELSSQERIQMLLGAGYTSEEIQSTMRAMAHIQSSRCDALLSSLRQKWGGHAPLQKSEKAWINRLILKQSKDQDEEPVRRRSQPTRGVRRSHSSDSSSSTSSIGSKFIRKVVFGGIKKIAKVTSSKSSLSNQSVSAPLTVSEHEQRQTVLARSA